MSFYDSKIQILESQYSKDLSIYLLECNHADEDELCNYTVKYEGYWYRYVHIRTYSPDIILESSSYESNMSRQNKIKSTKQKDVKVTMEREGGLPLSSCYYCDYHLNIQNRSKRKEPVISVDRWHIKKYPVQRA